MVAGKSPRYDADYDAARCASRNGATCRACSNRIAFMGKRGEKGAWNKPCQGVNKPDPTGKGRKRSSYGGNKLDVTAVTVSEDHIRPVTPEPENEAMPTAALGLSPDSEPQAVESSHDDTAGLNAEMDAEMSLYDPSICCIHAC